MQPELCDAKPQTGETFHRLVELAFPVTRRAGKVDRLVPKNASPARTDERAIAKGANIRRLSRRAFCQRVEDNAFHLKQGLGSSVGAPGGRALPITLTDWGADVASDERADGPLVLKWALLLLLQ
jgi:hypothetical protein